MPKSHPNIDRFPSRRVSPKSSLSARYVPSEGEKKKWGPP
jgi:hypothetical protein